MPDDAKFTLYQKGLWETFMILNILVYNKLKPLQILTEDEQYCGGTRFIFMIEL